MSRRSLPLPTEIIHRILYYVNRPWEFHQGPISGHQDLKSVRLVCKELAAIGARLLFEDLYISACFHQLNLVKKVSETPTWAAGVKRLIYDGAGFRSDCKEWDVRAIEFRDFHVEVCRECYGHMIRDIQHYENHYEKNHPDSDDSLGQEAKRMQRHLDLYCQLYDEQTQIWKEGLDYQCLREVLPRLTGLRRVVYRPYIGDRWTTDFYNKNSHPPPRPRFLRSRPTDIRGYELGSDDELKFVDLTNLLRAVAEVNPALVHALDIKVDVFFLQHLQQLPSSIFSSIRMLFSRMETLRLYFTEPYIDEWEEDTATEQGYSTILTTGVLADLLGAAKNLKILKLSLAAGGERRGIADGRVLHLPLRTYLGPAADCSCDPETQAANAFPKLKYLYLSSIDTTEEELVSFIKAHRGLEVLDFDRVTLTKGQWGMVGAAAALLLRWRKLKNHRLKQEEEVDNDLVVPEEWKDSEEWHEEFRPSDYFILHQCSSISVGHYKYYSAG